MKLNSLLRILVVSCSLLAKAGLCQPPDVTNAAVNFAPTVHQRFVCNTGYPTTVPRAGQGSARCARSLPGAAARRMDLGPRQVSRLETAEAAAQGRSGQPGVLSLGKRETFLEEALVAPVPLRRLELMTTWSASMNDLLEIAVTHELGHALCHEEDEAKADRNGKSLRQHDPLKCK